MADNERVVQFIFYQPKTRSLMPLWRWMW